jgi:hypothetical protein
MPEVGFKGGCSVFLMVLVPDGNIINMPVANVQPFVGFLERAAYNFA